MMVQHRLIGNIPGRGHGAPLLSTGFPLDFALAAATSYRAPDPGQVPGEAASTSADGKYHVFLKTYEVQATHFGRYALISTCVFRPAQTQTRPMTYMNTVVITDEGGAPERFLPPKALMAFSGFVQPAQFAALSAADTSLPCAPWMGVHAPERSRLFTPRTAAHRVLLARFWAAASARIWGDAFKPVTVCLGDSPKPDDLTEGAKALLLCDILDALPPAVQHIASMSVGATTPDVFPGSAMVVVYPTVRGDAQPDFDLRRPDASPALSPQEDRFIRSILEDGWCAFMQDAIARYGAASGCADEARISFTSDYAFVSLMDLLERSVRREPDAVPLAQCLAIWRQLHGRLIQRHRLSAALANATLAGVEAAMLPTLLTSPRAIAAIDETLLAALWEKLMTVEEELAPSFAALIAASAHVSRFPALIESRTDGTQAQAERAALLLRQIAASERMEQALTPESIAAMTTAGFEAVLLAQPPVRDALCDLLRRANAARPDRLLLTLPLSCRLLDGRQVLSDTISLLRRAYVKQLPGEAEQANLREACARHIDGALRADLNGYFADCLPVHLQALNPLLRMILGLVPEAGDTLCALLDSAKRHGILLSADALLQLLHALLPRCAQAEQIGPAYAAYESALSAQTNEAPLARLARLAACAQALGRIGFDATNAVAQMLHALGAQLLTPEQADMFATSLLPLCWDQARVAEAFHTYLLSITQNDPLYYFTNAQALTSLTPFIRVHRTDMTDTVCGILSALPEIMPCAPAERLRPFLGALLPQCQDRARVMAEFDRYIDASIARSLASSTDGFPWLCQIQSLCAHLSASNGVAPPAIEEKIVRYFIRRSSASAAPIGDEVVHWWRDLAEYRPDIFQAFSGELLNLYDRLLSGPAQAVAAQQLDVLLPLFASTTGHRAVMELDQWRTTEAFRAHLTNGKTLFNALSAVQRDANRCGLSQEAILGQSAQWAQDALRREFAALTTSEAYANARKNGDSAYVRLHNSELASAFDAFAARCAQKRLTLEQMDRLNRTAERLGTRVNSLPALIHRLEQTIMRPGAGLEQFGVCLREMRASGENIEHIAQELRRLMGESSAALCYPQNVYAALLAHIGGDGTRANWSGVLAALGVSPAAGTPTPYSPEGLAWLSVIHAVFRVLDELSLRGEAAWGEAFLAHMGRGSLGDFREKLLADRKKRARHLPPEVIASPLMRRWLAG